MLADSYIVPECLFRPGTLGGLISLYESNFIKLSALLGEMERVEGQRLSRCERDCDLHLSVEEGSRYTRILRLTYLFDEQGVVVAEPDMCVRLYFDARVAEVLGWADVQRHEGLRRLTGEFSRELDRRWARNMVLGKWLDFLLENGHGFGVTSAR